MAEHACYIRRVMPEIRAMRVMRVIRAVRAMNSVI